MCGILTSAEPGPTSGGSSVEVGGSNPSAGLPTSFVCASGRAHAEYPPHKMVRPLLCIVNEVSSN